MEERVTFPCGDISLEGLPSLPTTAAGVGVVVCHPHPLYGGDMHNAIVAATHNPFFYSSISATSVALFGFLSWISIGVTAPKSFHVRSAAQHAKIFDAIAAGDQKAAIRAMTLVIQESLKDARSQITPARP